MTRKVLRTSILWISTAVAFAVIIIFIDRNSYLDRAATKREIESLRTQRDYYLQRIHEDSIEIARLRNDHYLETYAREHFLMRRDSDVVYVLEPLNNI
jgi:cell division protein FtsB